MEIRKLTIRDYDELLHLLNHVFANKYGRAMDFLSEQPKMWIKSDEAMGRHRAVFENGKMVSVAGIYPLSTVIMGEECNLFTTGNVATLPEYEGRGYFTALFKLAMQELIENEADAARLGGSRLRYGRYGFEPLATSFKFIIGNKNVLPFAECNKSFCFREIEENDTEALDFVHSLVESKDFYVRRKKEELYFALRTKHSTPYLAMKNGEAVGYLCATADGQYVGHAKRGRHITEHGVKKSSLLIEMVNAWQNETTENVTLALPPHQTKAIEFYRNTAEDCIIESPSHFKIINFERLASPLIKLRDKCSAIDDFNFIIDIKDYGKISVFKSSHGIGAERTLCRADVVLTRDDAARLLFGHLPASYVCELPAKISSIFPLPFSWNTMDYV